MNLSERKYLVYDALTAEGPLDGMPSLALWDEGSGEAYFRPDTGIWYLKDERNGYVSPTGEYRRVRIVLNAKYVGW
jgi:hypothetical protein